MIAQTSKQEILNKISSGKFFQNDRKRVLMILVRKNIFIIFIKPAQLKFKVLMKALLFSIFIFFFNINIAQTKVYEGNNSSYNKVICNLDENKIYNENSSSYNDILINISGNKIYEGNSTNYSKVLYSVKDGKVYRGNSSSYNDVLMNIKDGKIYKENSSSYNKIIANIKDHKVYEGSSSSYNKVLFNIENSVRLIELVAIWHVVNYVY